MKRSIKILVMLAMVAGLITFYSCSDDEGGGGAIALTSLTAGTIDLNGATAAVDVPVDAAIVAVFTQTIDATSTGGITLTRFFDDSDAAITVTVVGNTATITPDADLSGGAQYVLEVSGLKDAGGHELAAFTRSFTTAGIFTPEDAIAYWNFNDNTDDQVGSYDSDVEVALTYASGRNTEAGKAGVFNGTTSIVEVPNGDDLITATEFSLSFWIDVDTTSMTSTDGQKGHFVMGCGAFFGLQFEINGAEEWCKFATQNVVDNLSGFKGSDFFFNADGATQDNIAVDNAGLDNATTFDEDFGKVGFRQLINPWAHIVYTYSNTTGVRSLYINGDLVFEQDFDDLTAANGAGTGEQELLTDAGMGYIPCTAAPAADDYYDTKWNFGFWTSSSSTFPSWGAGCCQYSGVDNNHFKGMLDDVRMWHRAISADEIELMYNSEKP